MLGPSAQF